MAHNLKIKDSPESLGLVQENINCGLHPPREARSLLAESLSRERKGMKSTDGTLGSCVALHETTNAQVKEGNQALSIERDRAMTEYALSEEKNVSSCSLEQAKEHSGENESLLIRISKLEQAALKLKMEKRTILDELDVVKRELKECKDKSMSRKKRDDVVLGEFLGMEKELKAHRVFSVELTREKEELEKENKILKEKLANHREGMFEMMKYNRTGVAFKLRLIKGWCHF